MAKISFSKESVLNETPNPDVLVESTVTACAPVEGVAGAVGIPGHYAAEQSPVPYAAPAVPATVPNTPIAFDDDDIRFEDIYLPKLNIVHNVGELCKIFNSGDVVLNATYSIHTPSQPVKKIVGNPPLVITIVGFKRKQYVEKLSQADREAGERGLLLNTEAEVVESGGTLVWKQWKQNIDARAAGKNVPALRYFETLATALLFVERPAHLPDEGNLLFPYECEGKYYALALWGMKGTAFTNAAKHFFTAKKIGHLKAGYLLGSWDLTTELETYGKNITWIPEVRAHSNPNSPALVEFIRNVVGCAGK